MRRLPDWLSPLSRKGGTYSGGDRELDGDPTPNPTLVLHRGEKVRLILTNQDRGMTHDFAVDSLDLATDPLLKAGTATSLVFEAPERPGESEYVCSFHALMMKGVLKVQ